MRNDIVIMRFFKTNQKSFTRKCMFKAALATAATVFTTVACTLVSCEEAQNDTSEYTLKYLPVRMEKDGKWSIIDKDGKIVVDNEYAAEDSISRVFSDGQYWVKSGGKHRLFNIDSPKMPVTEEEYDAVTDFVCGRAFVSHLGEPIQMINSKGKVIATLSKDIKSVHKFSDGLAKFIDSKGKCGYLNTDGEIAIKAKYCVAYIFNDDHAFVREKEDGKWLIIDTQGNKTGEISKDYHPWIFQDGKSAITKEEDGSGLVFVNYKGETVVKPKKDFIYPFGNKNGNSIVIDKEYNFAVINEQGNIIIRTGKYKMIFIYDNGKLLVQSDNKWGVVDIDDNKVVDFIYDDKSLYTLGDNYIFKDGSTWVLVDKNGTELKGIEFGNFDLMTELNKVTFTDIKAGVNSVVGQLTTTTGYKPLDGKTSASEIAAKYKIQPDEKYFGTYIKLPESKAGEWPMTVTLEFDSGLTIHNSHVETVNDGWFTQENVVDDGIGWNPDAALKAVYQQVTVTDANVSDVSRAIGKALEAKGFKAVGDGPVYEAKKSDGKYIRILTNEDTDDNTVTLTCYPDFDYSEEDVDYD